MMDNRQRQYTQQSNRDHKMGGELAVVMTMRKMMTVSAVAAASTTTAADNAVGGMANTG